MRSQVLKKLALVFFAFVVLEMLTIGNPVESSKGIKKKIILKKLKQLLPLLSLIKDQKVILLPIPVPVFTKNHSKATGLLKKPVGVRRPTMAAYENPMSVMMMADLGKPEMDFKFSAMKQLAPMVLSKGPAMKTAMITGRRPMPHAANSADMAPAIMTMFTPAPSMMAPFEPDFSSNWIQMSTSMNVMGPDSSLGGSMAPPKPLQSGRLTEWKPLPPQQKQQPYHFDHFENRPAPADPAGGQYYSSPWAGHQRARPLPMPAKVEEIRHEHTRQQNMQQSPWNLPLHQEQRALPQQHQPPQQQRHGQQQQQEQQHNLMGHQIASVSAPSAPQSQAVKFEETLMPVLVVKDQWKPVAAASDPPAQPMQDSTSMQKPKLESAERGELIPDGPIQMMPIYQTEDGRFHLSPPPGYVPEPMLQHMMSSANLTTATTPAPTSTTTTPAPASTTTAPKAITTTTTPAPPSEGPSAANSKEQEMAGAAAVEAKAVAATMATGVDGDGDGDRELNTEVKTMVHYEADDQEAAEFHLQPDFSLPPLPVEQQAIERSSERLASSLVKDGNKYFARRTFINGH